MKKFFILVVVFASSFSYAELSKEQAYRYNQAAGFVFSARAMISQMDQLCSANYGRQWMKTNGKLVDVAEQMYQAFLVDIEEKAGIEQAQQFKARQQQVISQNLQQFVVQFQQKRPKDQNWVCRTFQSSLHKGEMDIKVKNPAIYEFIREYKRGNAAS